MKLLFIVLFSIACIAGLFPASTARCGMIADTTAGSETRAEAMTIPTPTIGMLGQVGGSVYDNRRQIYTDVDVRLLRLYLYGDLGSGFFYRAQGDLRNTQLLDIVLSDSLFGGWVIDAGQFKAPFGKEWLIDDEAILFVDRSIIARILNPLRQRGVQVRGTGFDGRASVTAGVFNGNGMSTDNKISLLCARVAATPVSNETFGIDVTGSFAYSNDPNDLYWLRNRNDHVMMLGGSLKATWGSAWAEVEDAAALFNGEVVHGFHLDACGRVASNVELAGRIDYLNYFSQNNVSAHRYFSIDYDKKYVAGINYYPAPGVKLALDYVRDETFNNHTAVLNLQYAIRTHR